MVNAWPWLAVAGIGALHGLNPATGGWLLAAGWGACARDDAHALRALLPIAVGHIASVAAVAGAVVLGLSMDRAVLQAAAAGWLVVVAMRHVRRRCGAARRRANPAGHATLALGSFIASTAHGAGLMLVPALLPICVADGPMRQITASGSLVLAVAALGVHAAAMLAVVGLVAVVARRVATRVLHVRRMASPSG